MFEPVIKEFGAAARNCVRGEVAWEDRQPVSRTTVRALTGSRNPAQNDGIIGMNDDRDMRLATPVWIDLQVGRAFVWRRVSQRPRPLVDELAIASPGA